MTRGSELSRVRIVGGLPAGWRETQERGVDLRIDGPSGTEGVAGSLRVWIDADKFDGIEQASMQLMKDLQVSRPEVILTNCELWPHPVWGDGRYIQSAYIDGQATMAHDVYLFVDGDRCIRVVVDCALADLLALEETIAGLVAHLDAPRPVLR